MIKKTWTLVRLVLIIISIFSYDLAIYIYPTPPLGQDMAQG